MNWDAIGAIGEVAGAAGVIITLAYLAVQVRQNTRSQRAETYGRALDRVSTLQGRMSENDEMAAILRRGTVSIESLSPNDRVRFTWIFYEMFSGFEFMFHQARNNALPEAVWERWGSTLRWWVSQPGVREWWEARPTPFTADFTRFVEDQIAAGFPDSIAHERWVKFLTGPDQK